MNSLILFELRRASPIFGHWCFGFLSFWSQTGTYTIGPLLILRPLVLDRFSWFSGMQTANCETSWPPQHVGQFL